MLSCHQRHSWITLSHKKIFEWKFGQLSISHQMNFDLILITLYSFNAILETFRDHMNGSSIWTDFTLDVKVFGPSFHFLPTRLHDLDVKPSVSLAIPSRYYTILRVTAVHWTTPVWRCARFPPINSYRLFVFFFQKRRFYNGFKFWLWIKCFNAIT